MFCMKCGKEIGEGNRFCLYCGAEVVDLETVKNEVEVSQSKNMFCEKCGKKMEVGDRFCLYCGAEVVDLETVKNSEEASRLDLGSERKDTDAVQPDPESERKDTDVMQPQQDVMAERPKNKKKIAVVAGVATGALLVGLIAVGIRVVFGGGNGDGRSGIFGDDGNNTVAERDDVVSVGDHLIFGHYEQNANHWDGAEPLEWVVLDVQDGKALLITRYVLGSVAEPVGESLVLGGPPTVDNSVDARMYRMDWWKSGSNKESYIYAWDASYIRAWMNENFYETAFSEDEKAVILESEIEGNNGGEESPVYLDDSVVLTTATTTDRIFALSLDEVRKYFSFESFDEDKGVGYSSALITDIGSMDAMFIASAGYTTYTDANGNQFDDTTEAQRKVAFPMTSENYNSFYAGIGYPRDVIGQRGACWYLRTVGIVDNGGLRRAYPYTVAPLGVVQADTDSDIMALGNIYVRPAMWIDISANEELLASGNEGSSQQTGGADGQLLEIAPTCEEWGHTVYVNADGTYEEIESTPSWGHNWELIDSETGSLTVGGGQIVTGYHTRKVFADGTDCTGWTEDQIFEYQLETNGRCGTPTYVTEYEYGTNEGVTITYTTNYYMCTRCGKVETR